MREVRTSQSHAPAAQGGDITALPNDGGDRPTPPKQALYDMVAQKS